jgi:hypothetical protein
VTDCGEHARCILALEDGTLFFGERFGAEGTQTGEVVFNTSMTGYQEVLTDPSYCGQIVTMTSPQIGNYGVNNEDVESSRPHVAGFIVKELARRHSNYRATLSLDEYLAQHNIIDLQGVDTRALTKRLRVDGAMRGVLTTQIDDPAECVLRTAAEWTDAGGCGDVVVGDGKHCDRHGGLTLWTGGERSGRVGGVFFVCGITLRARSTRGRRRRGFSRPLSRDVGDAPNRPPRVGGPQGE